MLIDVNTDLSFHVGKKLFFAIRRFNIPYLYLEEDFLDFLNLTDGGPLSYPPWVCKKTIKVFKLC
jgi:hypothetical protein